MHSSDAIIAGAGIIGLSLGLELRRAGASVTVLDRREPGREASSAAAGMLAIAESHPILKPLAEASARLYPAFVEDLERDSGAKVEFENRGALYVADEDERFSCAPLSQAELRELEPELAEHPRVHFLKESTVDPRLLVRAALLAARNAGVKVHHEAEVLEVSLSQEHHLQVRMQSGVHTTATFVNCAGAWSRNIAGAAVPARPMKGQMLAVIPHRKGALRHVVRSRDVYLVPREDGRVLIGATVEDAGFDKTVDPATIQRLHQAAANLVPAIGEAKIIEAWAGLRPGSPDALPILGPCRLPGTYAATGHFRNGILLAPITAVVMSELIQGKRPQVDLQAFSPSRFTANEALGT